MESLVLPGILKFQHFCSKLVDLKIRFASDTASKVKFLLLMAKKTAFSLFIVPASTAKRLSQNFDLF